MMKIVVFLVILGLCANISFAAVTGVAVSVVSQSGAFSSSVLNSTAIQVLKGSNSTDAANWDSSSATTNIGGVEAVMFGAGATNDTSYLWGIPYGASTSATSTGDGSCGKTGHCYITTLSSIRKRTINNTIVGWGNDTVEASVLADTAITTTIMGSPTYATGPGYLAVLSTGLDTVATPNNQVWITLVSGVSGSASSTKVTSTSDTIFANTAGTAPTTTQACVATTFGAGNVWYDRGTGAFFYTYWKNVATSGTTTTTGTCLASPTNAYTIYLGGIYVNGTALLATPISVGAVTSSNAVSYLIGGADNTNAAAYIWLAYKDTTSTVLTTYVSKTAISANTTAVGSFSSLVKDTSTGTASPTTLGTNVVMTYAPATIWSSNNSYAVTVANTTSSTTWSGTAGSATAGTPMVTYGYVNYFNGTTTGVDTGLTTASTSGTPAGYMAWQLNTGYTVVSGVMAASGTPEPTTYSYATFWANGTVNTTSATAGTLSYGAPQFYEDVNGTMWIGWYDVDTANSDLIYNAYLAKFQGQLNIPMGASILSAISAFFALFLAAIFVF